MNLLKSPWWQSIQTKIVIHLALCSLPILLIGFLTVWQSKQRAVQVDQVLSQSQAIARTAQEALVYLANASADVHRAIIEKDARNFQNIDSYRRQFEDDRRNFHLLIKALTWGTEGKVFREDNDGQWQKDWEGLGWKDKIGSVQTSDNVRQFAGEISVYYAGFVKYAQVILGDLQRLRQPSGAFAVDEQKVDLESFRKMSRYEQLVSKTIDGLLEAIAQDAVQRKTFVRQQQYQRLQTSIIVALVCFLVAIAFSWLFATYNIVRPLHKLKQQVEQFRRGDMKVDVSHNSSDEIGLLAQSFGRMAEDLDKTTVSRDELKKEMEERQRLENVVLQSDKMAAVGQLAGGIAHDLNNQLTPLNGYLDLLQQEPNLNDESRLFVDEASRSARRCTSFVQELLNYSRPSTQNKSVLDVHKLLDNYHKLLRPMIASNIAIHFYCQDDMDNIYANEAEIQSVLMNFATNARDAMTPNGGTLSIDARCIDLSVEKTREGFPPGRYAVISISDTGCGMTAETAQKIFDPFFTTKPKGKGTGLGLTMVVKVVTDHGGWVDVATTLGKGSTFRVYLPVTLQSPEDEDYAKDWGDKRGNGEMVLFAEDKESLRKMGKVFLERLGYRVMFAANGQEALEAYRKNHSGIAVVVMDMTMPLMPGRQLLKNILQINPRARILVATGYTFEGSPEDLIADGAMGFIQKPYTIRALGEMIHYALSTQL